MGAGGSASGQNRRLSVLPASSSSIPTANTGNGGTTTYSNTGGGTSAFNVGRGEHAAALAGKWIYFIGGWNGVTGGGANFSPSIDALDTTLLPAGGSSGGVDGNGGQTKARGYTRGDGS